MQDRIDRIAQAVEGRCGAQMDALLTDLAEAQKFCPSAKQEALAPVIARVKERLKDEMRDGEGDLLDAESIKVEVNGSDKLFSQFISSLKTKETNAEADEPPCFRFLWHATRAEVVKQIWEDGFTNTFASLFYNVYGAGLYFATDAKLSAKYQDGDDAEVELVLALVSVGRVGVRQPLILQSMEAAVDQESDAERQKAFENSMYLLGVDLRLPPHRNPPKGCQSATGPHKKELVVYKHDYALPFFRVKFRLRKGKKYLPDPYARDTNYRLQGRIPPYLRPLGDVPLMLGLAEGEIDQKIDEHAELMDFPRDAAFPTTNQGLIDLKETTVKEIDKQFPGKTNMAEKLKLAAAFKRQQTEFRAAKDMGWSETDFLEEYRAWEKRVADPAGSLPGPAKRQCTHAPHT